MRTRRQGLAAKLPIYRLAPRELTEDRLDQLATRAFGLQSYGAERMAEELRLSSRSAQLKLNARTGALWMADEAQLWKPEVKPRLPKEGEAARAAREFLRKHDLLPKSHGDLQLELGSITAGGTVLTTMSRKSKRRQNRKLDVHVSFGMFVQTRSGEGNAKLRVPIIGEAGKLGLTIGDRGQVIAHNSGWRAADGIETQARVIPQEEADARFRDRMGGLKIQSSESSLAYQAVQREGERAYLCPVWVHRSSAWFGDRIIPLRNITAPATEFGPKMSKSSPQPKRSRRNKPAPWAKGVPKNYQKRTLARTASNPFEAGTSWIGQSGGLAGSKNNAKGFVDGLRADGWTINFNWGDANAWESDWRRNDDDWVDAADFVFYTGHADGNGWVLSSPDDGSLSYTEVGTSPQSPGDLYGQQDLEWVIVAACGPLEDDVICAGGGDVFDRWDGAFDGLHLLMGYGSVTNDNEDEGNRIVQYARGGSTLIDAWFRTGREIQPSTNGSAAPFGPTVWVGVMYVTRAGLASAANDHLWGHGSVGPDPTSPDGLVAMWTTC
jgi:hypothetical protein